MINLQRVKSSHVLIAGLTLLLSFCYVWGFKKTIDLWQVNRQLKIQGTFSDDLAYQPDYLNRKNSNLDKIIRRYHADTAAFRNKTINEIALIAEHEQVKLSTVPATDDSFHNPDYNVELLAFEGDYFSLTKTIHVLEATPGIGVIRSENWKLVSNEKPDAAKHIVLELYFEIAK